MGETISYCHIQLFLIFYYFPWTFFFISIKSKKHIALNSLIYFNNIILIKKLKLLQYVLELDLILLKTSKKL